MSLKRGGSSGVIKRKRGEEIHMISLNAKPKMKGTRAEGEEFRATVAELAKSRNFFPLVERKKAWSPIRNESGKSWLKKGEIKRPEATS